MKNKSCLILVLLVWFSLSYSQTNYYVKPSGDDNKSGLSIDDAWQTIQKAADEMVAGDTVFVKSGLYNEIVIPLNSGTSDKYITYTAYPGDTAIIDGSDFATTYLQYSDRGIFDIKEKQYINVIGLHIQNSAAGGIMCRYGSSNINIANNNIYHCDATGIGAGYSRDTGMPLATNINAFGNVLDSCSLISRESLSFRSVDTFAIYDNEVKNTPKEAIDVKSGCSNGAIYNNVVSNADAVGIYIDAGYTDILYSSQNNIEVYQNLVVDCKSSIAVSSENECLGENIRIFNNVIYDNSNLGQNGITVANFKKNGPLQDIYIINNTIYGKGHRGIYINNLNVRNIYIRNNICSQNSISQIDVKSSLIDSVYLDHNLVDGYTVDYGSDYVEGSPGFVNAAFGDFHLGVNSMAKDKGTSVEAPLVDFDGTARPQGSGFDIGAYEYVGPLSITSGQIIETFCYPNPTQGKLYFNSQNIKKIRIYNVLGQLVQEINGPVYKNSILLRGFKGIHFIEFIRSNNRTVTKVIVI